MRKLLVACGALVAMMFTGCVPSPTEQCKMMVAANCDQMFKCYNATELEAMKSFVGASVEECKTKMETAAECATMKTEADLCHEGQADAGMTMKTYDLSKASACLDKTKAASCDAFKASVTDSTKQPVECSQMCK